MPKRLTVRQRLKADNRAYFDAFKAGERAAFDRKKSSDCPYPKTKSFRVHRDGWINGFTNNGGKLFS